MKNSKKLETVHTSNLIKKKINIENEAMYFSVP